VAYLTIRNLDTDLLEELAVRASYNGRTPAEEARAILRQTLTRPLHDELGNRLHFMFARLGGAELELPARTTTPRVPELANPPRLPEHMP
jgi:antitoxin FitA